MKTSDVLTMPSMEAKTEAKPTPCCGNCPYWKIKTSDRAKFPPHMKECWWGPPQVISLPVMPQVQHKGIIVGGKNIEEIGVQMMQVRPRTLESDFCFRHLRGVEMINE